MTEISDVRLTATEQITRYSEKMYLRASVSYSIDNLLYIADNSTIFTLRKRYNTGIIEVSNLISHSGGTTLNELPETQVMISLFDQ